MKKSKRAKEMFAKSLLTLALAFGLIFVSGTMARAATTTTVPAAPGQVTGVKQTDAGTGNVRLEWQALLNNGIRYSVQIYSGTSWIEKEDVSANSAYISGLNAGTSYQVKVVPYVSYRNDNWEQLKVWGKDSAVLEVVTTPNSKPSTIKHTKSTDTSVTVQWSAVPGANTYCVEYIKDGANSSTAKKATATGTSIALKSLSKNSEYTIRVYPGRKTSTGAFVKYSSGYAYLSNVPVKPSKVSGLEVSYYWQYIKQIQVECNKNKAADGYQWQLYTAYKSKDTKVKSASSGSNSTYFKSSAIGKHNFYKVRVRCYCTDSNGKKYYSPWTSWKYVCPQPDVKLKNTSKGMKVSWDKIKGADRYVVYMSTKKDSGYKKVATTGNTSKVITKIGKSKLKSGKTYYVRVVAQNKVGKKYYSGAAGDATDYASLKYKKK